MINHELSTNKLMILYMLKQVSHPLTNTQISEFIITKGYTNYFSFQEYLNQLIDSSLIRTISTSKSTSYQITYEGINTLDYFGSRLSEDILNEINLYIQENKYDMKEEVEIYSNYEPTKDGDYLVHLVVKENGKTLIDLTMNVFEKEYAVNIAEQWKEQSHIHYKNIFTLLTKSMYEDN